MTPTGTTIAVVWENPDGLQCILRAEDGRFAASVMKDGKLVMGARFDDEGAAILAAREWRTKFDGSYWRERRSRRPPVVRR
jgi:hypothetical protein